MCPKLGATVALKPPWVYTCQASTDRHQSPCGGCDVHVHLPPKHLRLWTVLKGIRGRKGPNSSCLCKINIAHEIWIYFSWYFLFLYFLSIYLIFKASLLPFSFRQIVGKTLSWKYVRGPSPHCQLCILISFTSLSSRCWKGALPSAPLLPPCFAEAV